MGIVGYIRVVPFAQLLGQNDEEQLNIGDYKQYLVKVGLQYNW
jgi:hypothetical protein